MVAFHFRFAGGLALVLAAAPAITAPAPVFSPASIEANVTYLADDLLEGRETGTRGHEIAARYVAAQFASYGLQPGGKDGSWFQRVTLQEARLTDNVPARVTIAGAGKSQSWANATDVILGPSQLHPVTNIEAPVVFVGFGLDAPAQGFDDYAGLDVRGKIVAVLSGIPKGPPDEIWAHLATQTGKMAAARGAIGMVSIPTIESEALRPWAKSLPYAKRPRLTWLQPDGKPFVSAPGILGGASLNAVSAAALFAGAPVSLAAVQAEADKVDAKGFGGRPKGFALATTVHIEASSATRQITSPNVIGRITGSDPKLRDEYVVLMGHLDHLGIRPEREGDKIYNGALDNAAGTAMLLEVARAFGKDAKKPRRSLLFVASTAEEKGLLGAEGFANDPSVPIGSIVSVVDLDQPMLLYDFTDVIAFGGDHSTMGAVIAKAAAQAGVKVAVDPMPAQTIFVRSDHYTFVKRGVPAVMLATGYGNGGEAAWTKFLSTNYHQPSDDLSQPINWAAGAKFAKVNYLVARDIANAPERPRWYAGDYFGATFAPDAPTAKRP